MGLMVASAEALSYVLRNRRRQAKTFAVISFGNDVRFVPIADIPPFQSIVVGADGSCIAGRLSFTPIEFG
jgi:hypothetical protein